MESLTKGNGKRELKVLELQTRLSTDFESSNDLLNDGNNK